MWHTEQVTENDDNSKNQQQFEPGKVAALADIMLLKNHFPSPLSRQAKQLVTDTEPITYSRCELYDYT